MTTLEYLTWIYRWNRHTHGRIVSALMAAKSALEPAPF